MITNKARDFFRDIPRDRKMVIHELISPWIKDSSSGGGLLMNKCRSIEPSFPSYFLKGKVFQLHLNYPKLVENPFYSTKDLPKSWMSHEQWTQNPPYISRDWLVNGDPYIQLASCNPYHQPPSQPPSNWSMIWLLESCLHGENSSPRLRGWTVGPQIDP